MINVNLDEDKAIDILIDRLVEYWKPTQEVVKLFIMFITVVLEIWNLIQWLSLTMIILIGVKLYMKITMILI